MTVCSSPAREPSSVSISLRLLHIWMLNYSDRGTASPLLSHYKYKPAYRYSPNTPFSARILCAHSNTVYSLLWLPECNKHIDIRTNTPPSPSSYSHLQRPIKFVVIFAYTYSEAHSHTCTPVCAHMHAPTLSDCKSRSAELMLMHRG